MIMVMVVVLEISLWFPKFYACIYNKLSSLLRVFFKFVLVSRLKPCISSPIFPVTNLEKGGWLVLDHESQL